MGHLITFHLNCTLQLLVCMVYAVIYGVRLTALVLFNVPSSGCVHFLVCFTVILVNYVFTQLVQL